MSDNRQSLADIGGMQDGTFEPGAAPVNTAHTGGGGPPAPLREQEIDAYGRAYATGKRKNAIARVWLKPGTGKIIVNGRDQTVYFARPTLRLVINQPFDIADRRDHGLSICDIKTLMVGRGHRVTCVQRHPHEFVTQLATSTWPDAMS